MARDVDGLPEALTDGFTRHLEVDVLHGTDRVASAVVDEWSLTSDLSRDPRTTGSLRIVHSSVKGESWVPDGVDGVLSPFRATLLLTEVVSAGQFTRRVQLGMFDVVEVPFAEDVTAHVGGRWVSRHESEGDIVPVDDMVPFDDVLPGEFLYAGGQLVGGHERVVASIVDVEVESLDGRVLGASLRSPRTTSGSALAEWRHLGLLPVAVTGDGTLPPTTWPAEQGSRLDAVHKCAQVIGGTAMVDSFGQWVLVDDDADEVTLTLGDRGTVTDVSSSLTLDGFYNVVVGNYETEDGREIRATWVAPGSFSPEVMGREIVRYAGGGLDGVRTQSAAQQAVNSIGEAALTRTVDVEVVCVYNPLVELGDRATLTGWHRTVSGVVQKVSMSDQATMQVVIREARPL